MYIDSRALGAHVRAHASGPASKPRGGVQELSQQYLRTNSTCSTVTSEYEDTNQVGLQALWGLWVFLAAAILGAAVAAGGQYGFQRLTLCAADPADGPAEDEIKARAEVMVRTISRAITERSRSHRRTASSTGGGGDGDSVEGGSAMSFSASVTRANSMSHSHALSGALPRCSWRCSVSAGARRARRGRGARHPAPSHAR